MRSSKLTLNTILLMVIIFSVIGFFFTVFLTYTAGNYAVNDYYPLEGTEFSIRYSNKTGYGLYQGSQNTGVLKVKGNFGHDWGAVVVDDVLYTNEFVTSEVGVMVCRLVRIDLSTFEKETLMDCTVLRGRCASGELVCISGVLPQSDFPETNSLCRFYAMVSEDLEPDAEGGQVVLLDPGTAETVLSFWDENAMDDDFEERYLDHILEEIAP